MTARHSNLKRRLKEKMKHGSLSGIRCPSCTGPTDVIDSRVGPEGAYVRRRRLCLKCASRFTTYERIDEAQSYERLVSAAKQARRLLIRALRPPVMKESSK